MWGLLMKLAGRVLPVPANVSWECLGSDLTLIKRRPQALSTLLAELHILLVFDIYTGP